MSQADDEEEIQKDRVVKKTSKIRIAEEIRVTPSSTINVKDSTSPRNITIIKKPKFNKKKSILPDYAPRIPTPRKGQSSAVVLPAYNGFGNKPQGSVHNVAPPHSHRVGRIPSTSIQNRRFVEDREPEFLDNTPEGDTPEGNYVIQNLEYAYELDEVEQQLANIEHECTELANEANFLSSVFRIIDTVMFILVIGLSVVSSIFALNGNGIISQNTSSYVSGIMSICAAGIEGLRSSFSLSERGKTFKDIYLRTLVIARKSRALRRARISRNEIEKNIEKLREKLINLQLSMYETSLPESTTPTSYAERIEKSSDGTGYSETVDYIESNVPRSRIATHSAPSKDSPVHNESKPDEVVVQMSQLDLDEEVKCSE